MLAELADATQRKVARRRAAGTGWSGVQHAMLVAHDLPRGLFYMPPWNAIELLTRAVSSAQALDAFDEVLFVTRQDGLWRVIRIAGGPPLEKGSA